VDRIHFEDYEGPVKDVERFRALKRDVALIKGRSGVE